MKKPIIALCFACATISVAGQDTLTKRHTIFDPVPRHLMRDHLETDRPDVTESPFTVDAGHLQYESDIVRFKASSQEHDLDRQVLIDPFILKVGLSNNLDLHFAWEPYHWEEHHDQDGTDSGYGNTGSLGLRLKYNLVGNHHGNFSLALLPYIKFPTHRFFDDHGLGYGLIIPAELEIGKKWTLGFQGEADVESGDDGNKFRLLQSVVVGYELTDKLKTIAETYYVYDPGEHKVNNFINCALQYDVLQNLAVDAGLLQGFQQGSGHQYYVGMAFRW